VVFDLRGNRGGLLGEAVTVAGSVLGSGLVGTTAGRDPAANRVLQADGIDLSGGLPVVVLVDGRSASAAEIVAAALADDRRAVVVGSATLGKGLIQSIMALPDGGELLVSWSRVLAPLGWPIQGLGVMPQLCTSLGEAVRQAELDRLLLGEAPMRSALMESRTARAPLPLTQTLEIRSACPAAIGQDADLQTARMLIENPGFYDAALLAPQFLPPHPAILSGQGLRGG
jgi:carboxyl-terminal processing protease